MVHTYPFVPSRLRLSLPSTFAQGALRPIEELRPAPRPIEGRKGRGWCQILVIFFPQVVVDPLDLLGVNSEQPSRPSIPQGDPEELKGRPSIPQGDPEELKGRRVDKKLIL